MTGGDTLRGRWLEDLYARYHARRFVSPDPLQFLYDFGDPAQREVIALIAASLAYGRVMTILTSVEFVIDRLGPAPRDYLLDMSRGELTDAFAAFRHRFAKGHHMTALLCGIRKVILEHGSLRACFLSALRRSRGEYLDALERFSDALRAGGDPGHLIPRPSRGSACKRLHLFLRWMVRKDAVDPGGWEAVGSRNLVVPLDVHMHRIGLRFGLTARKQADIRTALEVTRGFAEWVPDDPVRYDFVLTRFGIWGKPLPRVSRKGAHPPGENRG